MPLVKPLYTARATATGGRSGHAVTDDGMVDVHLQPPKEMGGPGGAANPEQLFAAATPRASRARWGWSAGARE